jgi:hypothetical protein
MRTQQRLSVALAAILLLGLAPLGWQVAEAHTFTASPSVKIHVKGRRFYGRVRSAHLACKRHRRVTVVRARRVLSDIIVDRTRTGLLGRWHILRPRKPNGRFYALIPRKVVRKYGHLHVCRADRSRTIRA